MYTKHKVYNAFSLEFRVWYLICHKSTDNFYQHLGEIS